MQKFTAVVLLFLLGAICSSVSADSNEVLADLQQDLEDQVPVDNSDIPEVFQEVIPPGDEVHVYCSYDNAMWTWRPHDSTRSERKKIIARKCKVLPKYKNRFTVDTSEGGCKLIVNVAAGVDPAGNYTCRDPIFKQRPITEQLTPLGGVSGDIAKRQTIPWCVCSCGNRAKNCVCCNNFG